MFTLAEIRKKTTPNATTPLDDDTQSKYRLGWLTEYVLDFTFSRVENLGQIQEGIERRILEERGIFPLPPWETPQPRVIFISQFNTRLTVKLRFDNFLLKEKGDIQNIQADFMRIQDHSNTNFRRIVGILTPAPNSSDFSPIPSAWDFESAKNTSMIILVDRSILVAPKVRLSAEEELTILEKRKQRIEITEEEQDFILKRRKEQKAFEDSIPPAPKPKPKEEAKPKGIFRRVFDFFFGK